MQYKIHIEPFCLVTGPEVINLFSMLNSAEGVQWLSGRALDSRPRGPGFEPQGRHCVVSLSKTH